MSSIRALVVALLAAPFMTACLDMSGDITGMHGIGDYAHSDAYAHVSAAPYPSDLGKTTDIDVWVSSFAAKDYLRITPEADGSGVELPEGTTIIRAVHDNTTGELTKLTIMVKASRETSPELDGWIYAVTDPDGVPLLDDDGRAMQGNLEQCQGCHLDRASDGFLFGVPAWAQKGAASRGAF
jgi:hypothetical protein